MTARRRNAGLTLIELLITVAIMALLAAAVAAAFVAGLDAERTGARRRDAQRPTATVERRITALLLGAKLGTSATDRTTYFVGDNVGDTLGPVGATGSGVPNPGGTLGGDGDMGCSRLTFTTAADDVPMRARDDADDFETQQTKNGPVGGIAEVEWATTPLGDAGDKTGLYQRLQRPSDGDPSQGGTETLLDAQIDQIGFQFWNGTDWVTTWDTINGTQRRLPAAVRVQYTLSGEPKGTPHAFVVPIPASDVTAQNPLTTAPGGGTGQGHAGDGHSAAASWCRRGSSSRASSPCSRPSPRTSGPPSARPRTGCATAGPRSPPGRPSSGRSPCWRRRTRRP
jgi:prepilin-type N-terminal cleavage/methylation domain-containing protein